MNELINNTDFWVTVSAVLAAAAANSCISRGSNSKDKRVRKGESNKND
ncbi:MAG: hypothetical protein IJM38_01385 [Ruminococcus sp.]|nr:hypothetical protein [Ruminococcus sp.]